MNEKANAPTLLFKLGHIVLTLFQGPVSVPDGQIFRLCAAGDLGNGQPGAVIGGNLDQDGDMLHHLIVDPILRHIKGQVGLLSGIAYPQAPVFPEKLGLQGYIRQIVPVGGRLCIRGKVLRNGGINSEGSYRLQALILGSLLHQSLDVPRPCAGGHFRLERPLGGRSVAE